MHHQDYSIQDLKQEINSVQKRLQFTKNNLNKSTLKLKEDFCQKSDKFNNISIHISEMTPHEFSSTKKQQFKFSDKAKIVQSPQDLNNSSLRQRIDSLLQEYKYSDKPQNHSTQKQPYLLGNQQNQNKMIQCNNVRMHKKKTKFDYSKLKQENLSFDQALKISNELTRENEVLKKENNKLNQTIKEHEKSQENLLSIIMFQEHQLQKLNDHLNLKDNVIQNKYSK